VGLALRLRADGIIERQGTEHGLAIVPAPAPSQEPLDARLNPEKEICDIKILSKTGRLPPGFNR
jgi:hypothetical protein